MLYVFKDNRNSSSRKETKNCSEAALSCLERTEGSIIFDIRRDIKIFVVLEARLELARSCPRKILSLVCLPIPPFEQEGKNVRVGQNNIFF